MRKIIIGLVVAAVCVLPSSSIATRGLDNRNPGNIVKTDTHWKGEVECDDSRFECFMSDYYGLRAMATILNYYQTVYGISTVGDVLYRWMPPSENPTSQIVNNVLSYMCSRYEVLSIETVMSIIVLIENGKQPFSIDEYKYAVGKNGYESVVFHCKGRIRRPELAYEG